MIPAFPKIFALGSKQTQGIFNGEVEITEKIDGSQIGFGKVNGELIIRSKGQRIYLETVDKMFSKAVEVITEREKYLPDNVFFYGEYLQRNKHNCLCYGRVPKNNIALYGVMEIQPEMGWNNFKNYLGIQTVAHNLDLDVVPLIFQGLVDAQFNLLTSYLERDSYLGKSKIEGLVVKNYAKNLLIGGQLIPVLMGKYVSEAFKEVNQNNFHSKMTSRGKWESYKEQFRTEARWHKAIQHLREKGELLDDLKDIGKLMKEINEDIISEEKENIKGFLWREFGKELLRYAQRGFPEWYKQQLLTTITNDSTSE